MAPHSAAPHAAAPHADVIRLLVADPYPVIRWGLAQLASQQEDITCVGEAGTAVETFEQVAESAPTVLVIATGMPDADTFDVVRDLRVTYHRLGIVVLTP